MMKDIVERLREIDGFYSAFAVTNCTCREAATEIERLREALRQCKCPSMWPLPSPPVTETQSETR